ncbi:MAG: type IV pilus modification protein PilV [Pseudohongiellaceae bacterium]
MRRLTQGQYRQQAGASLIEVLVALLILSIGLLGMVGLQTTSLRNTQNAYLRTQAMVFAEDMVERMRANPQGVDSGGYMAASGTLTAACLTTSGCSGNAMALHDVADWQADLAIALPSGSGRICTDSTPDDGTVASPACDGSGDLLAVKVWWDGDRDGTAGQRLVATFQP